MELVKNKIESLKNECASRINSAQSISDLETIRIQYLGRSGAIANLMGDLKTASLEEKRTLGPALNELKNSLQALFDEKLKELEQTAARAATQRKKDFDVTTSINPPFKGTQHIYTTITQRLNDIFISMGYQIVDGPEVETDFYNFQALNIPADHPARDMHDTFWVDVPGLLLRTHTSPVQVRTMEAQGAPLALFAPGRTYRNEATDASHDFQFAQGEILFVDKGVSVAHLIATAKTFLQQLFGVSNLEIRVRPGYFPFVEPGLEIDAQCPFCTTGCSTCKYTRWIELLGSGMVHPTVLRHGGIDPDIYSGFAIGFGLSRLAMINYAIDDIRLLHSSKINFLNQF
jgi:phenylalanyl-tRNA synthetase alpha chain